MNKPKNVTAAADQLILDIKALVLLSDSQQSLRKVIEDRLIAPHDDELMKFTAVIRSRQKSTELGYFLMAMGELILAAFLVIAGLAIVAPSLLGLSSPTALTSYYGTIILAITNSGLSSPALALVNFVFAIALLLAGFYSLRAASSNLKEAGVVSGPHLD